MDNEACCSWEPTQHSQHASTVTALLHERIPVPVGREAAWRSPLVAFSALHDMSMFMNGYWQWLEQESYWDFSVGKAGLARPQKVKARPSVQEKSQETAMGQCGTVEENSGCLLYTSRCV